MDNQRKFLFGNWCKFISCIFQTCNCSPSLSLEVWLYFYFSLFIDQIREVIKTHLFQFFLQISSINLFQNISSHRWDFSWIIWIFECRFQWKRQITNFTFSVGLYTLEFILVKALYIFCVYTETLKILIHCINWL